MQTRRLVLGGLGLGAVAALTSRPALVQSTLPMPDIPSSPPQLGLAAQLQQMFRTQDEVRLPALLYEIESPLFLPRGKRLIGSDGTTIRLSETARHNADAVVRPTDDCVLSNIILDGNLEKRRRAGALTRYVFGCVLTNISNATVEKCVAINCGATPEFFASNGGNGGGFCIQVTRNAQRDVTNNHILRCTSLGESAGFHARIESPFRAGAGTTSWKARNNRISFLEGHGGDKNAIELAGPNTSENTVSDCVIYNPLGQGGIEADFGASFNQFERCRIIFENFLALRMGFDAFSQRTADVQEGPVMVPTGNRFIDCSLTGSISLNSRSVHAFTCFGAGSDASFIRAVTDLAIRREGQAGTVIGMYVEDRYQPITNIVLKDERFHGVDKQIFWHRKQPAGTRSPWN